MRRVLTRLQRVAWFAIGAVVAGWPLPAAAQETVTGAPKSFVPNYTLLVLLLFLVMFSVTKASHRTSDIKVRVD